MKSGAEERELPANAADLPAADALVDAVSVESVVSTFYELISGPAGEARDWDRFRALFAPGARLIPTGRRPTGEDGIRVFALEDYIRTSAPYLERHGFFEREVHHRMERFGNVAHVWSTYESRHTSQDQAPFMRGINSIQLYHDGQRWWVVAVVWDSEGSDRPIPPRFLPAP